MSVPLLSVLGVFCDKIVKQRNKFNKEKLCSRIRLRRLSGCQCKSVGGFVLRFLGSTKYAEGVKCTQSFNT